MNPLETSLLVAGIFFACLIICVWYACRHRHEPIRIPAAPIPIREWLAKHFEFAKLKEAEDPEAVDGPPRTASGLMVWDADTQDEIA